MACAGEVTGVQPPDHRGGGGERGRQRNNPRRPESRASVVRGVRGSALSTTRRKFSRTSGCSVAHGAPRINQRRGTGDRDGAQGSAQPSQLRPFRKRIDPVLLVFSFFLSEPGTFCAQSVMVFTLEQLLEQLCSPDGDGGGRDGVCKLFSYSPTPCWNPKRVRAAWLAGGLGSGG